jgi:uncharacterized membrane protein
MPNVNEATGNNASINRVISAPCGSISMPSAPVPYLTTRIAGGARKAVAKRRIQAWAMRRRRHRFQLRGKFMSTRHAVTRHPSRIAPSIFELMDPIPYGLFVGTLIFDITYMYTRNVFWAKGAAWLVTAGLIIAIIPRLLNLGHVWLQRRRAVSRPERVDFWLKLLGIAAAIANALVHSRDAYAMVPDNVVLSVITVVLFSISHVVIAMNRLDLAAAAHD